MEAAIQRDQRLFVTVQGEVTVTATEIVHLPARLRSPSPTVGDGSAERTRVRFGVRAIGVAAQHEEGTRQPDRAPGVKQCVVHPWEDQANEVPAS